MVALRLGKLTLRDRRTASFLEGATRVRVFRLDPSTDKPVKLSGYSVKYEGKVQSQSFALQLAAVLAPELKKQSYFDFGMKGCDPEPGIAFRVENGGKVMDVVLCYECNQLQFIDSEQSPTRVALWKYFDLQRPALVNLAKQAFPNDAQIQRMEEKRR